MGIGYSLNNGGLSSVPPSQGLWHIYLVHSSLLHGSVWHRFTVGVVSPLLELLLTRTANLQSHPASTGWPYYTATQQHACYLPLACMCWASSKSLTPDVDAKPPISHDSFAITATPLGFFPSFPLFRTQRLHKRVSCVSDL